MRTEIVINDEVASKKNFLIWISLDFCSFHFYLQTRLFANSQNVIDEFNLIMIFIVSRSHGM